MLNKMKSRYLGKNIIILFFIMTAYMFSQSWNNTITTTINEPNLVKMDLFTNKDGNHIIVQNSNSTNSIKYYLLNSSGAVIRSATIETSGGASFPNISGDNDKVYLVYKLGSNLKANYTSNAGQSWNTVNPKAIGSNTCNGVDIVYDYSGLHVVYAMKDSDPYYETYYYKINSSNQWVDYKNVTDYGSEVGGFPTVTISDSRVHVSYNTGDKTNPIYNQGEAKTRDKNSDLWEDPQLVFGADEGNSGSERIFSNSSLYNFIYKFISGMGNWHFDLYVKNREINGASWSTATLLEIGSSPELLVSSLKTSDGKTNIIYGANSSQSIIHKYNNGANWSSGNTIAEISSGILKAISAAVVSNDMYLIYTESESNYIKYRQYDAAPLAPKNVAVTSNNNNNPVISWSANNEADINLYRVYKKLTTGSGTQTTFATTTSTSYTDSDFEITSPKLATDQVEYWVVAVDINNHLSPESSHIIKTGESLIQWKKSLDELSTKYPTEYFLSQNYPNPFNPTTVIAFVIPNVEAQNFVPVELKVYDVLGREVATLVNEQKAAGSYEATFDASKLSSGIYFYKLKAGSFVETKKMILLR